MLPIVTHLGCVNLKYNFFPIATYGYHGNFRGNRNSTKMASSEMDEVMKKATWNVYMTKGIFFIGLRWENKEIP